MKENGFDQTKREMVKSRSTPAKMDKISKGVSHIVHRNKSNKQFIEEILERDFLEACPMG